MEYLSQLTIDDLPGEHRELAETIGLDAFRQLVRVYGGLTMYIPKADNFRRDLRNDEIREKFTGKNYRQLAQEYELSDVMIRQIVADIDKEMREKPLDGQMSLC